MKIKAILPVKAADPAGQFNNMRNANRALDKRYGKAQRLITEYIASFKPIQANAKQTFRQPTELEFSVNQSYVPILQINEFNYQLDAFKLQEIDDFIRKTLYNELLDDSQGRFSLSWFMNANLTNAYTEGTEEVLETITDLANAESVIGPQLAQQVSMLNPQFYMMQPQVVTRLQLVYASVFNRYKGLSEQTATQAAQVLTQAMRDGVGIREATKRVNERLGVSYSRAREIARTEIMGAYRVATADETQQINDDVFGESEFEFKLLWFSALAATTRPNHAAKHALTYTKQEVTEFYSQFNGRERYNCLCSQRPILVYKKDGKVAVQTELVKKMQKQKAAWKAGAIRTI